MSNGVKSLGIKIESFSNCFGERWQNTHKISEQVHIVFLDPVPKDFCCSVSLGEDELYEPGCLLLG